MFPNNNNTKKAPFELFTNGNFSESLELCKKILKTGQDPTIEILAATNLFYLGKLDDAEVSLKDLAQKMPESSHIHSYLAKVLDLKGDEDAITEYATAIRLDPENLDALRSYAFWLIARNDERGSIPVLKRLYLIGKRTDDLRQLIKALVQTGHADEACSLCERSGVRTRVIPEYTLALYEAGKYHDAANEAEREYSETQDPVIYRIFLKAKSRIDPESAIAAYATFLKNRIDSDIYLDYIRLLQERGEFLRALTAVKKLVSVDYNPRNKLLACDLAASIGDKDNALREYEDLIQKELITSDDSSILHELLQSYRKFIFTLYPPQVAKDRFLEHVPGDTNVVCLSEIARLFLDIGETETARSWYYRSYRNDYLNGGLVYAEYLAFIGETRECEKVLLHILANVKKSVDVSRVANAVTQLDKSPCRMKRVTKQLVTRLSQRRSQLKSDDREYLAAAYLREAIDSIEQDDSVTCMYNCLCGIEVVPVYSRICRAEDFLSLIQQAKEKMPTDTTVIADLNGKPSHEHKQVITEILNGLDLTDNERQIVTFLAAHRKATEADLRNLLGTRRVGGIINTLIRKTLARGLILIEKKGMSAKGELYEYCGPRT